MPSWKILVPLTVAALVAIVLLEPDYVALQTAATPAELRAAVGGDTARGIAAALADVLFAVGYGLLGVTAYAALARGLATAIGCTVALGAAAADVAENLFLIRNIARADGLTQGWVDAVLTAGALKWVLGVAAVALLVALAGRRLWTSTMGAAGNG